MDFTVVRKYLEAKEKEGRKEEEEEAAVAPRTPDRRRAEEDRAAPSSTLSPVSQTFPSVRIPEC